MVSFHLFLSASVSIVPWEIISIFLCLRKFYLVSDCKDPRIIFNDTEYKSPSHQNLRFILQNTESFRYSPSRYNSYFRFFFYFSFIFILCFLDLFFRRLSLFFRLVIYTILPSIRANMNSISLPYTASTSGVVLGSFRAAYRISCRPIALVETRVHFGFYSFGLYMNFAADRLLVTAVFF